MRGWAERRGGRRRRQAAVSDWTYCGRDKATKVQSLSGETPHGSGRLRPRRILRGLGEVSRGGARGGGTKSTSSQNAEKTFWVRELVPAAVGASQSLSSRRGE